MKASSWTDRAAANSPRKLRVAGYVRTSSEGQKRDETHENQIAWLQEQARLQSWDLKLFVEPGLSGETLAGRPKMRELLARVEAGQFDAVAAKTLDRLGRSQGFGEWDRITEPCERTGVRLFVNGMWLDPREPTQRFLLTMLGPGVAGFEKSLIVARTNAGRERAIREGRKPRGTDPLGLRHHRDTHTWEIVEAEAATVRRAFELAASGHSTRDIADQLSAEGRLGKSGKPFTGSRINRMLRSRTYVGEWEHSGGTVRVPPIIEMDRWERVQQRLGASRTYAKGEPYLLTGLVRCAACDLPAHTASVGKAATPYLRCASNTAHYKQTRGLTGCHHSWRRDRVEAEVWKLVRRVLGEPGFVEQLRARAAPAKDRTSDHRATVEAAEAQLATLGRKLEALTKQWSLGQLDDPTYFGTTRVVQEERAKAEKRLAAARRALSELEVAESTVAHTRDILDAYRTRLEHATASERQKIMRALCPREGVHGVWLHPDGRVEIRGIAPMPALPPPAAPEPDEPTPTGIVMALRLGPTTAAAPARARLAPSGQNEPERAGKRMKRVGTADLVGGSSSPKGGATLFRRDGGLRLRLPRVP